MVRVTSHLYIPLSSVALVSVALMAKDDVLLLLVTCANIRMLCTATEIYIRILLRTTILLLDKSTGVSSFIHVNW